MLDSSQTCFAFLQVPPTLEVNPNEPLGLIGWRGIVPAKAGVMSGRLVNMVTTELISVDEILKVRLAPVASPTGTKPLFFKLVDRILTPDA